MKKIYLLAVILFCCSLLTKADGGKDWTIVQTYDVPGKASGLAFDGTYLYYGIYGADGDQFYRVDPADGSYEMIFSNPDIDDSYGMTYNGNNLWIINQIGFSDPSEATEIDINNGDILSTIELPDHYMSGIAYDDGNFWVGTYYPDPGTIYEIDASGNILSQFQAPDEQTWDICVQDDNLWIVDYYGEMIYKTDKSGNVLESHPVENIKPAGIVYDGTYLWYVDGPNSNDSKLYKVDLGGTGTPAINVPVTSYDFGTVTVGNTVTWNMNVENTGTGELVVDGVDFSPSDVPLTADVSFPVNIPAGENTTIPIIYAPEETGSLNATGTINSNDPVNPTVDLEFTGNAVSGGPDILVPESAHNYGDVRVGANVRWNLTIINNGDEMLEISEINTGGAPFNLDPNVDFPIQLYSLDTTQVGIWFHPGSEGPFESTTEIISNDPDQSIYEVELSGTGVIEEYPMGETLWNYTVTGSYDNSVKAIHYIADINGDNVEEAIIASEDNYIRCLNGNSDGLADVMWATEIYSGSLYHQNALTTIEDVNGDGYEDVVAGTAWGDRSIIVLSGLTGEIIWKHDTHEYGDGGWVYQVDVEFDYNGDGIKDVLAATGDDSNGTGPQRVYCLDGTDGSSIWEYNAGGPVFGVKSMHDVTGDGIPDAVAGASNSNESQGFVYGIDGSSGSQLWSKQANSSSVWAVEELEDINGDGMKDVVAGDFSGNIYYLDGTNGSQLESTALGFTIILRFEILDDVNSDGINDVTVAYSGSNGVVLDGQTAENIWFQSLADKAWNVRRIGDISGDGINDVVIGTLYSNNYCYFLDGTSGEELQSVSLSTPVDGLGVIPDITGDGSMEVIVGGRNGQVYCYSGGLNTNLTQVQMIDLNFGYQFASSRLILEEPDMMVVLEDVLNDNLDFVRNSDGAMVQKIGPEWVNGIGDWITTEGYLFKMYADDSFIMSGEPIDPLTPIGLTSGYQFVSYLPEEPIDALMAFESIISDDLDFIRDSDGNMVKKIGPNWINNIGDATPGEGYLIKMFNDGELVYNIPVGKSQPVATRNAKPQYFAFNGGNPADPVFTVYVEPGRMLNQGDEIAVYDHGTLVGSTVFEGGNTFENAIPVFSTLAGGSGYQAGNAMTIKVWDAASSKEAEVSYTLKDPYGDAINQQQFPEKDGEYAIVSLDASAQADINVYPNPATNYVNVNSAIEVERIEVYNQFGQLVKMINANTRRIDVSNFDSGVYMLKITVKGETYNKRINVK
ncbi:MAG: choice-of-anchor D domain-containing protein [Bacteroidales bacterium]|nr:choice-of-anchor D domain-containing protein [Bacteroidales bacterium]